MNSRLAKVYNAFQYERGWFVVFGIVFFTYLYLAILLTTSYDFNDETEKFITARLIHSGLFLYKDIFVQHGPVAYIPSQILYSIFENRSLAFYRVIPISLSLLALCAIIFSPFFTKAKPRLLAGTLFLLGLSAYQAHHGFVMTMYQVYAGYLYTISMAIFILPFSLGLRTEKWQAVIAGLCLSLLFFCAFSFAIAILFCCALCIFGFLLHGKNRLSLLLYAFGGGLLGTLLVALWLYCYGDFVGYYICHFYINLTSYAHYLGFGSMVLLEPIRLLNPGRVIGVKHYLGSIHLLIVISVLLYIVSVYQVKLIQKIKSFHLLYGVLLICAIQYTNPRVTGGFADSTYIIYGVSFISISAGFALEYYRQLTSWLIKLISVVVVLCVIHGVYIQSNVKTFLYETSSHKYYKRKAVLGPLHNQEMNFLRKVVSEDETVLQLPFSLNFYVYADRLPASGIFFWMPWMNDYAKDPIKGYPLDLCDQMNKNPPKAIYYTDTDIWGNQPEVFMGCFKKLLKERYFRSNKVTNVWFRDDVVANNEELLNTSIITAEYKGVHLSKRENKKLQDLQLHYAELMAIETQQCILDSDQSNGPLQLRKCSDKKSLTFGFSKAKNHILSNTAGQCVDVHKQIINGDTNHVIRLWPCMGDNLFQKFTLQKVQGGFNIYNRFTDLCLTINNQKLIMASCHMASTFKFK